VTALDGLPPKKPVSTIKGYREGGDDTDGVSHKGNAFLIRDRRQAQNKFDLVMFY